MITTALWLMVVWVSGVLGFVLGAAWAGNRMTAKAQEKAAAQMYADEEENAL